MKTYTYRVADETCAPAGPMRVEATCAQNALAAYVQDALQAGPDAYGVDADTALEAEAVLDPNELTDEELALNLEEAPEHQARGHIDFRVEPRPPGAPRWTVDDDGYAVLTHDA